MGHEGDEPSGQAWVENAASKCSVSLSELLRYDDENTMVGHTAASCPCFL